MRDQQGRLTEKFVNIYGTQPRIFRAPGRVNLIGEHTDYNDGFVLPFAIDRETLTAGAVRTDGKFNFYAVDIDEHFSIDLQDKAVERRGTWVDYAEGIVRCLQRHCEIASGANLAFSSSVPIGAGLSSSAALEISIGYAVLALNNLEIDRTELAFAANKTEQDFVGIRSGIMDQFCSALGQKDHAMLLDCRTLAIKQIPLNLNDFVIAVCDSGVQHELASSEYNMRRRECETAVEIMREYLPSISSLRDVCVSDLRRFGDRLPEKARMRARHVISENLRTHAAAEYLQKNDLDRVGELMFLSHESLRNDYEVSSPELDFLVDTARTIEGVTGSRMFGGGFGGCTVNLLKRSSFERFQSKIKEEYVENFGLETDIYLFRACDGASEIT